MNRYKGIDCLLELVKKTPDLQYVVAGKQMTAWVIRWKNCVKCRM